MATLHSPILMSQLPVEEVMLHAVLDDDYWHIRAAHRHQGGRFGDCPAENYPRLTAGEMHDVMDAVMYEVVPSNSTCEVELLEEPF